MARAEELTVGEWQCRQERGISFPFYVLKSKNIDMSIGEIYQWHDDASKMTVRAFLSNVGGAAEDIPFTTDTKIMMAVWLRLMNKAVVDKLFN